MSSRSVKTDALTVRVKYVRDWLNKAEDAINRGDNIDAVTKLALAKADTTNLISMLIPQKKMRSVNPAFSRTFSVRKLAVFFVPLLLVGVFLLGMETSGMLNPGNDTAINGTPAKTFIRSINRPTPDSEPKLRLAANEDVPDTADEIAPVPERVPVRTVAPKQPPLTTPPVVSEPVVEVPSEPVTASVEITESTEDSIDLFGFGLDVIRSARENMGY